MRPSWKSSEPNPLLPFSWKPSLQLPRYLPSANVLLCGRDVEIKIEEAVRDLPRKGEDLRIVIQDNGGLSSMIGSKLANFMLTNYLQLSYENRKLPLYEANYGWGPPVWVVSSVGRVALTLDKDSEGVEALVTLHKETCCLSSRTHNSLHLLPSSLVYFLNLTAI